MSESENLNKELSKKNKEMDNAQQAKNKFKENINDLNKQLKALKDKVWSLDKVNLKLNQN